MRIKIILILTVAVLIVGCGPGSGVSMDKSSDNDGSNPAKTGQVRASVSPPMQKPGNAAIWFAPSELSKCGKPSKVEIHWDVRGQKVSAVEIFAVNKAGNEVLFFSSGPFGKKDSGMWMRGGSEMILRSKTNGSELGRAQISAIPCKAGNN